jgi:hypothetical protein
MLLQQTATSQIPHLDSMISGHKFLLLSNRVRYAPHATLSQDLASCFYPLPYHHFHKCPTVLCPQLPLNRSTMLAYDSCMFKMFHQPLQLQNAAPPSTVVSSFRYEYIATSPSLVVLCNLHKMPIVILMFPTRQDLPTKLLRRQSIHQLHHVQHPHHTLEAHCHRLKESSTPFGKTKTTVPLLPIVTQRTSIQ